MGGKLVEALKSPHDMIPGVNRLRAPDSGDKGVHDPANNKYVGSHGGSGAQMNVRGHLCVCLRLRMLD